MELTILILVSVLLTISSFFLSTIGCICVFATYLALNCCYFFFLKKRREKLKELSVQLDRLLHEGIQLPISDYCEGELSILANQHGCGNSGHFSGPHGVFQLLNPMAAQVGNQRPQQRLLIPVNAALLCHTGYGF
jgi:hypothetical protein